MYQDQSHVSRIPQPAKSYLWRRTPKVIGKLLIWTAPRASAPPLKTEPNTSLLLVTCSVIPHLWTGSSLSTRLREKTSISATPSKLSVRLSLQRGWLFCRPAKSTQSLLPRLVTHQIKLCILKAPLRKQHPPRGPPSRPLGEPNSK
jgi:hypothetical protein